MWKTPRTVLVAGAALVAGLGVGAAVVPAVAAQDPVLTPEQQTQLRQQLDAYRACLQQQGAALPEKPVDGSRPQLTEEQRATLRAAHEACASQRPARPELTDEQKAALAAQVRQYHDCVRQQLSGAGLTLPERPALDTGGVRPPRPELTDEQRGAIDAARTACADLRPNLGVEGLPFGRPHGPGGPGWLSGPGTCAGSGGAADANATVA